MRRLFPRFGKQWPKTPSQPTHRASLAVELLVDRTALSTITWVNEGTAANDRDGFRGAFGSSATLARSIVKEAIRAWETVIIDFNHSDGGNTYKLTVMAQGEGIAVGAPTELDDDGRPMEGRVR